MSKVLTPAKTRVLNCLVRGLSNKEIAKKLYLSVETVKQHMHELLEWTGCDGRTALAVWWGWMIRYDASDHPSEIDRYSLLGEQRTAVFKGETHEVPPPTTQRDGGLRAGSDTNQVNGGGVPIPGHLLPAVVTLPSAGA